MARRVYLAADRLRVSQPGHDAATAGMAQLRFREDIRSFRYGQKMSLYVGANNIAGITLPVLYSMPVIILLDYKPFDAYVNDAITAFYIRNNTGSALTYSFLMFQAGIN